MKLCTWYVVTTKEKMSTNANLIAPWSDTPKAHVTTFVHELDRR